MHARTNPTGWLPALLLAVASMATVAAAGPWPAKSYVIAVDGLACPYCGYGIEKQFHQHEGVERTEIDIEEGVVVVFIEPGTRFSDDELAAIVDAAGFTLGAIVHRPPED